MSLANTSSNKQLSEIIAKINERTAQLPLVFIAPDIQRGLAIEGYLDHYYLVTSSDGYQASHWPEKEQLKVIARDMPTSKLLLEEEFQTYLKNIARRYDCEKVYLQFFKQTSDTAIGELSKSVGMDIEILNNSAGLTREIENKVKQYQFLANSDLRTYLPETSLQSLNDLELPKLLAENKNYLLQFPFGHTGESTYPIAESGDEITTIEKVQQEKPNLQCKLSEVVDGLPFTINACNYRENTYVGGLSYQYTGVEGLTAVQYATVGNDWQLPNDLLSLDQKEQIRSITEEVGKLLRVQKQFRGMFGLDFVISDEKIYLIEINPRQVMSINMHTQLQFLSGQVPLSLLHIAEFLGEEIAIDVEEYNAQGMKSLEAAQVFLRSKSKFQLTIPNHGLKSGVYRLQSDNAARKEIAAGRSDNVIFIDEDQDRPLIWQQHFSKLNQFGKDGLGLVTKQPGDKVGFNQELARMHAHRSLGQLVAGRIQLFPFVSDTFAKIDSTIA